MISRYPLWLAVPLEEKDAAQGAHPPLADGRPALAWSQEHRLWYARPGADTDRLAAWLPRPQSFSTDQADPVSEFALTLEKAGLVLKGLPVMDGSLQRVPTRDDRGDGKSGAYRAWMDGRPAGWFRDYRSGEKSPTTWVFSGGAQADPLIRLHLRAQAQQNRDDSQREREAQYRRQANFARRYLDRCGEAREHPYLTRKGIQAAPGLRMNDRAELVVPLSNVHGEVRSFQRIPESGGKDARLLKDAEKAGNFFALGDYRQGEALLFAEGYATAATLHAATGLPVLMTVDAGNMVDVAIDVRNSLPLMTLVFCADNDAHLPVNKGVTSAQRAATLTVGHVLIPEFSPEETAQGLTDFNDLAQVRSPDAFVGTLRDMLYKTGITLTPPSEEKTMETNDPLRDGQPESRPDPADAHQSAQPESPVNGTPLYGPAIDVTTTTVETADENSEANWLPWDPVQDSVLTDDASFWDTEPTMENIEVFLQQLNQAQWKNSTAPAGNEVQPGNATPATGEQPASPVDAATPSEPRSEATQSGEAQGAEATAATSEQPAQPVDTAVLPEPRQPVSTAPDEQPDLQNDHTEPPPEPAKNSALPRPDPQEPPVTAAGPETATGVGQDAEPDGIHYAPRRPGMAERVSLDDIIRQLKWDSLPDNTVMYRLDDQPAFRDLGNRLEMADGASADDRKILAALAVAAKFYGGVIELTGSDAFRERAMALIVEHDIAVRMKNPEQRARLDALRKAHGSTADAVKTHIPTPDVFAEKNASGAAQSEATTQQPQQQQPASPSTVTPPGEKPGAVASVAPTPTEPESAGSPPPKLAPGQSVTAELTRFGEAEYGEGKGLSFFVELSNRDGSQIYWGRELEALVKNVRQGEVVTLTLDSRESFTVPGDTRPRQRNHWSLTPVTAGIAVSHDRPEQGMTVQAYDRATFDTLLTQVMQAWPEETKGLALPQGFTGDLLLGEDRMPVARPDRLTGPVVSAGTPPQAFSPVLGAVSEHPRQTDLLLIQGAGEHLQGVVRLNGTLYPALATPTLDGSQLVINAVTDQGLRFAGYGEAVNRHSDNPSPAPQNMVFTLKQRDEPMMAQMYTPEKQPDDLFRRLGFEQTWQQWSASPKPQDRQEKHHHQDLSHSPGR